MLSMSRVCRDYSACKSQTWLMLVMNYFMLCLWFCLSKVCYVYKCLSRVCKSTFLLVLLTFLIICKIWNEMNMVLKYFMFLFIIISFSLSHSFKWTSVPYDIYGKIKKVAITMSSRFNGQARLAFFHLCCNAIIYYIHQTSHCCHLLFHFSRHM